MKTKLKTQKNVVVKIVKSIMPFFVSVDHMATWAS